MRCSLPIHAFFAAAVIFAMPFAPARAEVLEEIVAWVDGEIITMSELQAREQAVMAELYRTMQGDQLDQAVKVAKANLLQDMIDQKIMLGRASRLFDLEAVGDSYLNMFRRQEQIATDQELAELLAPSGVTIEDFRRQLVENYAPEEILRMEVFDRIAVSDEAIATYYRENEANYRVPEQRELIEIVLLADTEDKRAARKGEAEALREAAAAEGADFAALAREHSESGTAAEGGSLGVVKRGDLSESLEAVAFSLDAGQVSAVLDMPYGLHLLKIESASDAHLKPLEDLEAGIRAELEERQYRERLREFQTKMRSEANVRVSEKYVSQYVLASTE